ncbi:MAG TPA: hypothetical protein VKU87_03050 [Thermomicrobiaceae bacterium]|nr:hypothetical protein [Thermomicrobiaceae bacterium]
MPGYNFPRLPLRALVESHGEVRSIERNRYFGLIEFGPHNVIYHEGRKHRISACVVPAGGFEARIFAAKLCHACGYVHPRDRATVDVCEHCGTRLDASTSDYPQALFEQTSVRAVRWTRITADEEERSGRATRSRRTTASIPARIPSAYWCGQPMIAIARYSK